VTDYSRLSYLEWLGIAIKSEIEAGRLYRAMLKQVTNKPLRRKLQILARDERQHRELFETLYRKKFPRVKLILPKKSLIPTISEELKKDLGMEELLELAMKTEKMSERFYSRLAQKSRDASGKRLLSYLASVERGHYTLLKTEYQNVCAFPDYVRDEEALLRDALTHLGP